MLAQQGSQQPASNVVQIEARAADAHTLRTDSGNIILWGTENIEVGTAKFRLSARTALDNLIGGKLVQCETITRTAKQVLAQCSNSQGVDLSLFMLQRGYLIVDRSVIYGSVFEGPYINAETQAQKRGAGLWDDSGHEGQMGESFGLSTVIIVSLAVLLILVGAFSVASAVMFRGFRKVADAQDRNTDFLNRERQLTDKEKNIVASMLEAELKANQSKIEAYLVVYEEMLKSLRDPNIDPKYKKSGDIVQLQPALDRSVFDGNTDKMDLLGRKLSSAVIHFYARIKTRPDFVNIDPDTPLDQALQHVEKSVSNARTLNEILTKVLSAFSKIGIGQSTEDGGD
ncbi:MAG: hypothetical protein DHS20C02_13350 [Micavibrio sp.]|nr:MAG: hypothetical protein DHS20C02_13350 [Micavibrio sp.]